MVCVGFWGGLLNKSVTSASAGVVFFLKLEFFDFSERGEDFFDVIFGKTEVDIANI